MSINHRAEAEKHLGNAARHLTEDVRDMRIAEVSAWIGQGHASLTREEEQAATTRDLKDTIAFLRRREYAMREAVSAHIGKAMASREGTRWQAARDLALALDRADCNMDGLIDNWLTDDGWDARSAWKPPASVSAGWIGAVNTATPADDPWAPDPAIAVKAAEPPDIVRTVLAARLAEMLLAPGQDDVHRWARNLAFELKSEGVDLTPAIEKRITDLTLGPDPAEPPF